MIIVKIVSKFYIKNKSLFKFLKYTRHFLDVIVVCSWAGVGGGDNTIMGKKGPQTENCPLENIQDNLFHFKGLQFELDKKF